MKTKRKKNFKQMVTCRFISDEGALEEKEKLLKSDKNSLFSVLLDFPLGNGLA